MTNPKIEKVKAEIEKAKGKISEYTAKLRALERQKTELEDEQIVALVRSRRISDAELNALMASLNKGEPDAGSAMPAVSGARLTGQEETRNANLDEN